MTDLRRRLITCHLEELRRLGVEQRDIELLFISNDYCRPDWGLVDDILDEEGKRIVRELFINAHDVARGEDELALRGRPN